MLIVLYLLVVLAVLFVAAAVATREEPVLVEAPTDTADLALPSGPMQAEDVAQVRFGLTLRGYRMAEVDTVLERLAAELADRDTRIGELERALVDLVEPELQALETAAAAGQSDAEQPAAGPEPDPEAGLSSSAVPVSGEPVSGEPVSDVASSDVAAAADVAWTTSAVAPGPDAVHAPVTAASSAAAAASQADDDLFPEVFAPEPAEQGVAEATELGTEGQSERWALDPGGPDALAEALDWATADPLTDPVPHPVVPAQGSDDPAPEPEAPWGRPGEDPVDNGEPDAADAAESPDSESAEDVDGSDDPDAAR